MPEVILRRCPVRLFIGLVFTASALPAPAADRYVLPTISLASEYSDNYRLDANEAAELSGWGALLDVAVEFGAESNTTALWVKPRILAGAYEDNTIDDLRQDDYYVTGGYRYKGETYKVAFHPNWSRESVLRSEIPDVNTDDVVDPDDVTDDSGRVLLTDVDRDRWVLPLDLEYSFLPVKKLVAGARYTDVSYDTSSTDVTDFTQAGVFAGYGQGITPRDWLTATLGYSRYEPDTDLNSDTYTLLARWQRNFSEVWWTYVEGGVAWSDVDVRVAGQISSDDETDPLVRAGLVRVGERSRLRLEAARRVLGTSAGELRERIEAKAVYEIQLAPQWSFLGSLLAFDEDAASSGDPMPEEERTYLRGRAGLGYSLRPDVMISAEYVYTLEDENSVFGDAQSNGFLIGVTYQPQRYGRTQRYRRR